MKLYDNITQVVGNTPLVKINRILDGAKAQVYAKLEFYNPSSTVKDRIGIAMIDDAEKSGKLKPGGSIVEATSGNTGVALAMVGAARGYKVILTMPDSVSKERRTLIKAYGAQLVLTPGAEGMKGAVAGIGTGGTITGIGQVLKEKNPNIKIFAVEPAASPILNGGTPAGHPLQGIGPNFIPDILDKNVYDEVLDAPNEEAIKYARRAGAEEGILAGISSGAALWAVSQVAKRPEFDGKIIVVIIPSFGERYLSTVLYQDLMEQ